MESGMKLEVDGKSKGLVRNLTMMDLFDMTVSRSVGDMTRKMFESLATPGEFVCEECLDETDMTTLTDHDKKCTRCGFSNVEEF